MRKTMSRKALGWIALALVCAMAGAVIGNVGIPAQAEQTVVVTSPFTEAISKVHESVVGVNNYQIVSNYNNGYGNGYGGGYGNGYGSIPWEYFGYGNGNGNANPYGYGNGNGQDSGKEVHYGSGSGVVVAEGYVLTNYHVVEDAHSLKISVSNEATGEADLFDATVAASEPDLDVAVLYVPDLKLAPVELGDSDTLQIGDWAILIGNSLGFTGTATTGIVSGLDRDIASDKTSVDKYGRRANVVNQMIQTDAAINSGNSGGGMFNLDGQLVGIPTLKYTGSRYTNTATVESIGMCIPVNDAKAVIEQAMGADLSSFADANGSSPANTQTQPAETQNGLSGKPRMGITVTTLNSTATQSGLPRGAYVMEVESGSPAEAVGMQSFDIIVEANGQVITSASDLTGVISSLKEGDEVAVKVFRTGVDLSTATEVPKDGEYVDLTVTLAIVDAIAQ